MKVLPHLFIFLFGMASFWGCSPNTTLSTNPCASSNLNITDCANGGDLRWVYFEITVSPPLPTTTLSPTGEYISFGITCGAAGIDWVSNQQAYPISTLTTDCIPLDSRNQHNITAIINYNHPHFNWTQDPFVPWIGQCHSLDLKLYSLDGTLIDSYFVPSIGTFPIDMNNGYYTFNYCGQSGMFANIGTLILPSCP